MTESQGWIVIGLLIFNLALLACIGAGPKPSVVMRVSIYGLTACAIAFFVHAVSL